MEELKSETQGEAQENSPQAELAVSRKVSVSLDKLILPLAILLAGLMISGSVLYTQKDKIFGSKSETKDLNGKVEVSADDDPVLGDSKAKVTIIEFSDFQCPFCRRFWKETFGVLKEDYIKTGKVRFVYRDFPLQFHPAAQPSAEAAECADDQGKFWEFHDKVFEEQEKLGESTVTFGEKELRQWAGAIGLNTALFNQCLSSHKYKEEVAKDFADGQKYGVSGTPSFFINGQLLVGALPYESFKAAIDAALK